MPENIPSAQSRVRVLIVDDSVIVREVLKQLLESDPVLQVVGLAGSGGEAVDLTAQLKPDLVTMDLVMPGMDGMEATKRIMARHPTPVLFLSAHFGAEGLYSRADAVAAGALDIVEKPALMPDWRWRTAADALIQKIKALSQVPVIAHIHGARRLLAQARSQSTSSPSARGPAVDVVAIGASSGGPRVLEKVLSTLPATYALGIVVIQHMAEDFMAGLLDWFRQRCQLAVRIAQDGDVILPRRVLFAPEGTHLVVQAGGRVQLSDAAPVNGHRPSVDVTFKSLSKVYGARAGGMLLTGMGSDGAAGLLAIRQAGGVTMVQDEESCAVFGMPRAAIELGAAQHVLSPMGLVRSLNALHVERVRSLF